MSFSIVAPLSLYSIPLAWFTTFYPMNMKFALIDKVAGYNNLQPRGNTKALRDNGRVAREIAARVERLEGAHLNGNEMLPLWIGAVLAGNFVGISNETLNKASVAFLGLRVLYNYIYANQNTPAMGWTRTAVWLSSLSVPLYLYTAAGNLLRAKSGM